MPDAPRGVRRRVHLPGLNTLRFLAALIVVVGHTGDGLWLFGVQKYNYLARLNPESARLAVLFFFVLSGFLITYLLLVEESETGTISVGAFYLRRILRIWPLYYLIVLLAFFVLPHSRGLLPASSPELYGWKNLSLYLTIFPNFAMPVWYAGHLWSIGVEEQFYLSWPVLMRTVHARLALISGVIAAYLAGLFLVKALVPLLVGGEPAKILLAAYSGSRIDAMAIGALGAWLLFRRVEPALRLLHSRWTQFATLAALAVLYLRALKLPRLSYEAYAALFMIVILNAAANPQSLFRHRGRFLERLGKISYGIYMYHPITVTTVIIGLGSVTADRGPVFVSGVYVLGIAITIFVAAVSYRFFESPILKQKLRASPLVTGDLAAER
jgi:peptidoglycan/LPS O-acetylase OafA/YrhL